MNTATKSLMFMRTSRQLHCCTPPPPPPHPTSYSSPSTHNHHHHRLLMERDAESAAKRIKETLAVGSSTVVVPKIGADEITTFYPPIGEGAFSKVYKGRCRGKDVAIKVLDNIEYDETILEEFIDEVEIMAHLLHPNIVLLMGACLESHYGENNWAIITEFLPRGDLYGIIHDPNITLSISQKIQFAIDVASGMAWLQGRQPMILHRDLKPTNVLVDENWACKICDFGLSQIKRSKRKIIDDEDAPGSVLWMAPEVLLNKSIDEKIDIYSFGLVLWEIITQGELFTSYDDKKLFTEDIAIKGVRPPIDRVPPIVLPLIVRCWGPKPSTRPTFERLIPLLAQARIDYHLPKPVCMHGGRFWAKYWKDRYRIPFERFLSQFSRFMRVTPSPAVTKILYSMIARESQTEPLVTIDRFANVLKWFGPMKQDKGVTVIDRIYTLLAQPWFFGDITLQDAEKKLEPHKHKPGTFLLRLNRGGSEAITKTPFTISRIAADGQSYHTRVYPARKGVAGFWMKIKHNDGVDLTVKQRGGIEDLIALVMHEHPSILKFPCSGHPYADFYNDAKKIGPYENAETSSEESLSEPSM
eukprot:TRINITY_DN498_c0_g1_i2.p1 TRINITY_DN498_c0_g1~~TRINITY_DN498_c0_g1_i2.p1  ORF type:complete len:584 (-),score=112.98 TRINITY_DN498_c0_g1_i2:95-1846(-)